MDKINILYSSDGLNNKNIMPQYRTIESNSKRKQSKGINLRDDPEYLNRLRQVLLKNQHNQGLSNVNDKNTKNSHVVKGYHQNIPETDQQQVVYVVEKRAKRSKTQGYQTKLPKIKKKDKKDKQDKKSQISHNQLVLIRNYMNADLVPFQNKNRKKKILLKKRFETVDNKKNRSYEKDKIYIVQTPIKELQQGNDEFNSSRTQKMYTSKPISNSEQIQPYSVGRNKKKIRIPNPQYYSSVIEIQRNNNQSSTMRDSASPDRQRLGRNKSNQKSWEEINPLILNTYFHRLKSKTLKKQQSENNQSINQSVIIQEKKPLPKIPQKQQVCTFIRNYIPEYTQIKIEELIKKDNFQIMYPDKQDDVQELYFGETKNSQKHGKGVSIKDKAIFQGQWSAGQKKIGIQKTEVGTYKGQFQTAKRDGKGEFFWKNGEYYSGEWLNGKKNGSGYWKSSKQESYMGQWNNGEVSGFGVHMMKNGQRYEGQFKNFLKHGVGKEEFPNGDWYSGKYVLGKPHGMGKYSWKCGVIFQGNFIQGVRQGKGVIRWDNIIEFQGQFKKDLPHGEGRLLYPNGDEFNGNFQFGLKNGVGFLNLRSQRKIIKGIWKEDILFQEFESL